MYSKCINDHPWEASEAARGPAVEQTFEKCSDQEALLKFGPFDTKGPLRVGSKWLTQQSSVPCKALLGSSQAKILLVVVLRSLAGPASGLVRGRESQVLRGNHNHDGRSWGTWLKPDKVDISEELRLIVFCL
jgi:hypothetical protein